MRKLNASKLTALKYLNEELLSLAEVQHWCLWTQLQELSPAWGTESESKAEDQRQEGERINAAAASEEFKNISLQHAAY